MTSGPVLEAYLAEVGARLPGPARSRTRACIVAELRSGLLDAVDAHQSTGLTSARAVAAAVGEFGDPGRVADGFRAELAATQARRVVVILLVTGPLVGLLWIATAMASHVAIRLALPMLGLLLVAAAVTVTAGAAVIGIAVTGRLTRWLPARPRQAPAAAAVAGFGAVGADALGLALLVAYLTTAAGQLSPVLAAAAAAASLARLVLALRAARQCLAVRASLT